MKAFQITLEPNEAILSCYLHDQSPEMKTADIRPAMLVFPGGGYSMCSDREAEPIALYYLAEGYNAFVLRYSVGPKAPFEQSFEDANMSMKYLHEHAGDLHINPEKIAVVGFSAGGHLAAALGTMGEIRPRAMVLGYPVTLDDFGPIMGKKIPSCDRKVTRKTPPAFIFSTGDDNLVPIKNSLKFATALADKDVFFELHIFPHGAHGLATGRAETANNSPEMVNSDVATWLPESCRFLRHIMGDFTVGDKENNGDFPNYQQLDLDTPLKFILNNEKGKAALEAAFPGAAKAFIQNPMSGRFSLKQIQPYAPQVLTQEGFDKFMELINS